MKKPWLVIFLVVLVQACDHSGSNSRDSLGDTALIYIDNGAVQCEYQGDSPQQTSQLLINEGIDVIESYCGVITGIAYPAVCGAGTSAINLHKISKLQLEKALELGFSSVDDLDAESGIGYRVVDCNS